MEVKRNQYRTILWHKSDCADVQDAVGHAMKLLDQELREATLKGDERAVSQMVKERSTLHSLLSAAIEI